MSTWRPFGRALLLDLESSTWCNVLVKIPGIPFPLPLCEDLQVYSLAAKQGEGGKGFLVIHGGKWDLMSSCSWSGGKKLEASVWGRLCPFRGLCTWCVLQHAHIQPWCPRLLLSEPGSCAMGL